MKIMQKKLKRHEEERTVDVVNGSRAKDRLIEVGLEAFSRYGIDGVTTRQLAEMADVNISAISYYFGGKDDFYVEVVRHLLRDRVRPLLEHFTSAHAELTMAGRTPEAAKAILEKCLRELSAQIFTNSNATYMAGICSRENLYPGLAFDLIHEETDLLIQNAICDLISCITGEELDSPALTIRATIILGMVRDQHMMINSVCRTLGWDHITDARVKFISDIVADMAMKSL